MTASSPFSRNMASSSTPHNEDSVAIKLVFISLIGMDDISFEKVNHWFEYNGISSLENLLDIYIISPESVQDPKYQIRDYFEY